MTCNPFPPHPHRLLYGALMCSSCAMCLPRSPPLVRSPLIGLRHLISWTMTLDGFSFNHTNVSGARCVCAFLVPFLVLISSDGSVHGVDMAGILFPFPISSTVPTQFSLRSIQTYLWGRYLYMYVCSLCCIFVSRNHNNKCQRQSFQICSNAAAQAIFAALLRGACFDVDTTMEPL